jgi:hypothetical protein
MLKNLVPLLLAAACASANAGVISQYSSAQILKRDCSNAVATGPQSENENFLIACRERGSTEEKLFFGENSLETGAVAGDFFTDDKLFASVTFTETGLALPVIKTRAFSDDEERNQANAYGYTRYQWNGAARETLEFVADIDFVTSGGTWDIEGFRGVAGSDNNYLFNAFLGVTADLVLDDIGLFVNREATSIIASSTYNTIFDDTLNFRPLLNPGERQYVQMRLEFTVDPGDSFYLYGGSQSFGIDGGYTDASSTMTTSITVPRLVAENAPESAVSEFLSANIAAAPVFEVSAPGSALLFVAPGLFLGLARRRRRAWPQSRKW